MISSIRSLLPVVRTSPEVFAGVLCQSIRALSTDVLVIKIPKLRRLFERHPLMPFHFEPEIFIQLTGATEFIFPDQRFALAPGEVAIIPKGMPHGEKVQPGNAFKNFVVSYYNGSIDMHTAHDVFGKPRSDEVHLFSSDFYGDLIGYLNRAAELSHADPELHATAVKGLLLAEFSLLLNIVRRPTSHLPSLKDTVELCEWLIQHNIQDENLGLQSLSSELGCSPAYLSRIFHQKTGEGIVERITRLRINNAMYKLNDTRLSIKAIAAACGFGNANYFARVFKQIVGCTPQEYRSHSRAELLRREVSTEGESPAASAVGTLEMAEDKLL